MKIQQKHWTEESGWQSLSENGISTKDVANQILKTLTNFVNASAEAAGLRGTGRTAEGSLVAGDIIQAVDGRGIRTVDDLYAVLEEHKAGEVVTLSILRAGKTVTVDVTLGAES